MEKVMRIIIVCALFAIAACAPTNHLALAQECGVGPECQELWDNWNEAEVRIVAMEKHEADTKACNNLGGIMVADGYGRHTTYVCVDRNIVIDGMKQVFGAHRDTMGHDAIVEDEN